MQDVWAILVFLKNGLGQSGVLNRLHVLTQVIGWKRLDESIKVGLNQAFIELLFSNHFTRCEKSVAHSRIRDGKLVRYGHLPLLRKPGHRQSVVRTRKVVHLGGYWYTG